MYGKSTVHGRFSGPEANVHKILPNLIFEKVDADLSKQFVLIERHGIVLGFTNEVYKRCGQQTAPEGAAHSGRPP